MGFIVMEFVPGNRLSEVAADNVPRYVDMIAQVIGIMSETHGNTPGPIDGGEPRGPIWAPDSRAYGEFESVSDLDAWFDRALVPENKKIYFGQYQLSFCHLDLARRNIVVTDGQTLYLLDWQCSGFYPRVHEIWNSAITLSNDTMYRDLLAKKLPHLSQEEEATHWLLWCVYRHNMLQNLSVKNSRRRKEYHGFCSFQELEE
ncbi:hypothetical protein DV735_g5690, partial [Chaetothyriales sp. CBS 134920]